MSTLIAAMSQHGTTFTAAKHLKRLPEDDFITIVDLKKDKNPDLDAFETIIIGGSIHAGNIQKGIKKFCQKNKTILLQKRIGLFLCCMEEGSDAQQQLEAAFDNDLKKHAIAKGLFGGEFLLEEMNFIEKIIVKKIAKVSESQSKLDYKAIEEFAEFFSPVYN